MNVSAFTPISNAFSPRNRGSDRDNYRDNAQVSLLDPSQKLQGVNENASPGASDKSDDQLASTTRTATTIRSVEPSTQSDKTQDKRNLSEEIELTQQIQSLAKRDREVRTHERVHASLAGSFGGSPQFQFQRGPDGVLYAVSGSVALDASPIQGNPEATERKARAIQRAALAPSEPSPADRAIAANAASMGAQARLEINSESLKDAGNLINAFA